MPNEASYADRCRRALRVDDDDRAAGWRDAVGTVIPCRHPGRRRYYPGAWRSWSRAHGTRRPRASLRMVAWTPSRPALNSIPRFPVGRPRGAQLVVALICLTSQFPEQVEPGLAPGFLLASRVKPALA